MRRIRGCELGRSTEVAGLTGHWFMIRSDPSLHVSNQYLQRKSYSGMIGGWHLKVFASQKPCQSSRQRRPRSPLGPPAPVAWRLDKRRDFLRLLLAGARNTVPDAERPKHTVGSVELVTKSKHTQKAHHAHQQPLEARGWHHATAVPNKSPNSHSNIQLAKRQPRGCSRTLSAAVARPVRAQPRSGTNTQVEQQNKMAADWHHPAREKRPAPSDGLGGPILFLADLPLGSGMVECSEPSPRKSGFC
jgi:hypothetical protein